MTDPNSTSAFDAVESDGFVDYYRLLDLAHDAPSDNLQARIAELYNDAQANRDHRNMSKRQQYQLMLELLPQARTILSDDERRTQYDAYLARHRAGETSGDHEKISARIIHGRYHRPNRRQRDFRCQECPRTGHRRHRIASRLSNRAFRLPRFQTSRKRAAPRPKARSLLPAWANRCAARSSA